MTRITEQPSPYRHLEKMPVEELTRLINKEDASVAGAIEKALPAVNKLIGAIVACLQAGGRLFYVGAGSGGRLSVLDIIELPTTFGLPKGVVNSILAGGIPRLAEAREEMEDDAGAGWAALQEREITAADLVVGISASGTTPFVLGALTGCRGRGIPTGCIVSNPASPIAAVADYPVEVITGPEFLTGSTRMKCGTAQKMLFDMISTTTMIRLGRVLDNQMIDVLLINDKITDRAVQMLMEKAGIRDYEAARDTLITCGSVRNALMHLNIPIA
jgi:N-acetylmuramic acid 6-phosphate etherase